MERLEVSISKAVKEGRWMEDQGEELLKKIGI